jgi:PncC family amidohydrolase
MLQQVGWRLTLAESCTGGWVAKSITDIAGSSAWFERGFVTYSNAAKEQLLGVSPALLAEQGAVSAGVVEAMAQGALEASPADLALAVSGIAGPDGGTTEKPGRPGLVCHRGARRTYLQPVACFSRQSRCGAARCGGAGSRADRRGRQPGAEIAMSARTARRRLFFALWPEPIAGRRNWQLPGPAIEASLGAPR